MGYLSWKTADDDMPLPSASRKKHKRPVYLLQPGGEPPIEEQAYLDRDVFGGVNAYAWLSKHNLPGEVLAQMSEDEKVTAGMNLEYGSYLVDQVTGRSYTVVHPMPFLGMEHLADHWDTPLPQFDGKSANELRGEGRFITKVPMVKYPLKFSMNAHAVYEDLPASSTMYVIDEIL